MATRTEYDAVSGTVLTAANLDTLAKGWIGYIEATADGVTSGTTPLTLLSVTPTVLASRRLRLTLTIFRCNFSVAADIFEFGFTYDGSATGTGNVAIKRSATGDSDGVTFVRHVATTSAGSKVITALVTRSGGTGTLTCVASAANPMLLIVEDMGGS